MQTIKRLSCFSLFIFYFSFSYGQTWDSVGCSGLEANCGGQAEQANCMAVYKGDLYAGGQVSNAGNLVINCVGRWNGSVWDSVKGGMIPCNGEPYAMMVYNGNLYVGGEFSEIDGKACNNLAMWNDTIWSAPGNTNVDGIIFAMAVYNRNLYVGGYFDTINGIQANNIAMWNGTSWSDVGNGITHQLLGNTPTVYALCVYNNKLYAGGSFDRAGNIAAGNIAAWDGSNWSALSSGIDSNSADYGQYGVSALAVYNGNLYAGGYFDSAGNIPVNNIAAWNGTSWASVGLGVSGIQQQGAILGVDAMLTFNGKLYVGGNFDTAGGMPVNNAATWNGTNWNYIPGFTGGVDAPPFVTSFAIYNGNLFATGNFDTAGSVYTWDIAMMENNTGINGLKNANEEIKVYPNPSKGAFTLVIASEAKQSPSILEVYNVLGEKVYCETLKQVQGDNNINLSNEPNGIYLYRVITETGELVGEGKVVIQR